MLRKRENSGPSHCIITERHERSWTQFGIVAFVLMVSCGHLMRLPDHLPFHPPTTLDDLDTSRRTLKSRPTPCRALFLGLLAKKLSVDANAMSEDLPSKLPTMFSPDVSDVNRRAMIPALHFFRIHVGAFSGFSPMRRESESR
jgi:hypothetical protein